MIRINLLAAERPAAKKKAAAAPGAFQAYLFMGLFAGGAAFFCAAAWWFEAAKIRDLNSQIAVAEKRQKELQAIKVQVDAFQQKKDTLQRKVDLIEQLKAAQGGPVHMLDEISKALPDFVWLTGMDQAGAGVKFTGESNSLTAVADFMSGLERSGWFAEVSLASSTQDEKGIVTFNLQTNFTNPEAAAKEKAAAEAARAATSPAAAPGAPPKKP